MKYIRNTFIILAIIFIHTKVHGQDNTEDLSKIIIKEVATDKAYGYKKRKHIKVGSIRNEYLYIAQLTGPNGEEVNARRLGSCCAVRSRNAPFGKAPLDIWEITYDGLAEPIIIYLNGYDYETPRCPVGLGFMTP